MKQKDIALIAVIVIVAGAMSLLLSKQIFTSPKDRQQEVEVVQAITSDFPQPDKRYFNDKAFDPTTQITIEINDNDNPFNSSAPVQ